MDGILIWVSSFLGVTLANVRVRGALVVEVEVQLMVMTLAFFVSSLPVRWNKVWVFCFVRIVQGHQF